MLVKALFAVIVFPFEVGDFKRDERVRHVVIGITAVFGAALVTAALANGSLAMGLGLLVVFGGSLVLMIRAHRRIGRARAAARARRDAARAAIEDSVSE